MPDKTTPHIENVAKALLAAWDRAQAPDDMLVVADRIDDLRAALSTTREPSEAEIAKATLAFNVFFHGINNVIEEEDPAWRAMMGAMRDALIAAARVRVGE